MKEVLRVLRDSVVASLEGDEKGSQVRQFHEYLDGSDDLEPEKIPQLKQDFLRIYQAFIEGMPLTEETVIVSVPVHATGYSPLLGVPTRKDARETTAGFLNAAIDECELAILANCGFGKHSASREEIKEAKKQLREGVDVIYLPTPEGNIELKIMAYDSNNNPKHGFLAVDGMWVPFKAVGLVSHEAGNIILAFMATMDYGSGNWELDRLDTELLYELPEKSSLFEEAHQKLIGKEFEGEKVREIDPKFAEFLKESPYFRQALNRICGRWREYLF